MSLISYEVLRWGLYFSFVYKYVYNCSNPFLQACLILQVIARDILMYFAASYLEVFLFEDKKNPRNGKQIGETPGGGHGKDCLCDHVKKHAFPRVEYHSLVNPNPGTEKLRACKPTFL